MNNAPTFGDLSPPRRVCDTKNEHGHHRTDKAGLELRNRSLREQDNNSERYPKGIKRKKNSHHNVNKERKIAQEEQEDHAEKKKNDEEFMQWGRGYVYCLLYMVP